MKRLSWALMAGLMAVGASACGDSASSDTKKADTTLYGMLHSVPDTDVNRLTVITYGNFERVRKGDEKGSVKDDLRMLLDRTDNVLFMPEVIRVGASAPEFADATGFDVRSVDASLQYGEFRNPVAVLTGRFDPGKVQQHLSSTPGGEGLRVVTEGEVRRLGLGSAENDFADVSVIRPLGEQVEIAVDRTSLVWSGTAEALDKCLAVRAGTGSLADDATYAAVATVLDGAGVTSAFITAPAAGSGWRLAGVGEVRSKQQNVVTVVLQYPDATSATAAVEAFRSHINGDDSLQAGKPWKKLLKISDLRNVGATMIATLTVADAGLVRSLLQSGDNLLQFG